MASKKLTEDRKRRLGLTKHAFHSEMALLPRGTKGHPNCHTLVERLEDDHLGRPQFKMECSRLPFITENGEDIDVAWKKSGQKWTTGVNHGFSASVTKTAVTFLSGGKRVEWDPVLTVGGVEYAPLGAAVCIDDPTNEYYKQNVLSWDYGVCERRIRVIEGRLRERWIFTVNPHAEIRIAHGFTGDLAVRIGLASSQNHDDGPLVVEVDGDTEIVRAAALAGVTGPFQIGASPETYNPDPHTESTSVDGLVRHTGSSTTAWAAVQGGAGSGFDDSSNYTQASVESRAETDKFSSIYRSIFLFNTAALPDAASISASIFGVRCPGGKTDTWTGFLGTVNVYASAPASNTALANGDFDSLGTTPFCDTAIAYADIKTDANFNTWALNAAGIAAVVKDGVTKLGLREATHDAANSAPTWAASKVWGVYPATAEQGAGYLPYLTITYTVPAAPTVTTASATLPVPGGATLNGEITATGEPSVTAHGFCWKAGSDPVNIAGADGYSDLGAGIVGTFHEHKTGLTENTGYYYRGYATNATGTGYGAAEQFTTGETLSGIVAIHSHVSTTATGKKKATGAAAIHSHVSVAAAAKLKASGVAAIAVAPTVTATANLLASGAVGIEGIATLSAVARTKCSGEAGIGITASLTPEGNAKRSGSVDINVIAQLVAAGAFLVAGECSIDVIASLVALGDRHRLAAAAIGIASSLAADANIIAGGDVAISAVPGLTAVPGRLRQGQALIDIAASITAEALGKKKGQVEITAVPSLEAAADKIASAVAAVQIAIALSAEANTIASGKVEIDGSVFVTAVEGWSRKSGFAAISIVPSVVADGGAIRPGVASIGIVPSVVVDGDLIALAAAAISASVAVTAEPLRKRQGGVAIGAVATLVAIAHGIMTAEAGISVQAAVTAAAKLIADGAVDIGTAATLAADGRRIAIGAVAIEAVASVLTSAVIVVNGEVHINVVTSLQVSVLEYVLQVMGYTGTLAPGDVLEIDCDAMTVKKNGVNDRAHFTGDFFKLYDGTTVVTYDDAESARTLDVTVKHKPRWL